MAEPYWASADGNVTLFLGDCLDVLRDLPADSVDAIVTDPPAGIAFMDREWDDFRRARNSADAGRDNVFGRTSARGPEYGRRDRWQFVEWLTERLDAAYRVLKPGGHALVWSIPRTSHWTAWAIEDAGFDIRDCVLHLFGSGFPKSLDVSKAIDKAAGAEREVVGLKQYADGSGHVEAWPGGPNGHEGWQRPGAPVGPDRESRAITCAATEDAARWEGWGTALKPGQEMWWLARKPLAGTVAGNVLEYGTGALNIDGCRVAGEKVHTTRNTALGVMNDDGWQPQPGVFESHDAGRWPPNVVLGPAAAAELDRQSGVTVSTGGSGTRSGKLGYGSNLDSRNLGQNAGGLGDSGGASRFFPVFRYEAKAPASERPRAVDGTAHPTVKPVDLMRWLVRLVTPPGGLVLDPFAGSGTTAEACIVEGFRCVLAEKDPASAELIVARLRKPIQPVMFGLEGA